MDVLCYYQYICVHQKGNIDTGYTFQNHQQFREGCSLSFHFLQLNADRSGTSQHYEVQNFVKMHLQSETRSWEAK